MNVKLQGVFYYKTSRKMFRLGDFLVYAYVPSASTLHMCHRSQQACLYTALIGSDWHEIIVKLIKSVLFDVNLIHFKSSLAYISKVLTQHYIEKSIQVSDITFRYKLVHIKTMLDISGIFKINIFIHMSLDLATQFLYFKKG